MAVILVQHLVTKTYILFGQCTWYVFDRRSQFGKPISTYWSDAKYWAGNAADRWLYSRS